ncbi:phosphoribosyl-ATP pyrophosphohydrolase [Chryseomicrobium palamuruense]|uniref:Phosphoribosyl-ATP pyrophosphohydrolase n=1 Tax=Chryseomicrobium palamuruense TaxID=682973 RepID=A0ABV8UW76_9BACL
MPIYNKLIRDRILEIIEKDGKTYDMEILSKIRHEEEIKAKLTKEVQEYQATQNNQNALEELADILELIHAALPLHNVTYAQLEEVPVKKKEKRGGFDKGIYLIEVHD